MEERSLYHLFTIHSITGSHPKGGGLSGCNLTPKSKFNPLNAELNPICHLLALLGAHHIFHVSGLRVK
jgi:hypothetical protein